MIPYDKREGKIWYNNELVDWNDVKLHVLSHGLHYASCVFEGLRVYDGEIFKLEEHTDRLFHSAKRMDIKIPYSKEEINNACKKITSIQNVQNGYVRPFAWRGSEMMGVSAQQNTIHLAIAAWPWPSYFSPEARMKGIRLTTAAWRRPAPDTAPTNSKAAGLYMICTMSKHAAEAEGYDDALMLDWRGQVAESTGANIFLVFGDNKLHTPVPDCFLNGITRQTIIELAKARGIEIIERAIMPNELSSATEVFLTGTAAEVTPVGEIDDHKFAVGEISRAMMDDYDKKVGKVQSEVAA